MKRTTIILTMFMMGISLFAQENKNPEAMENKNPAAKENKNSEEYRTLFGGDHTTYGGYGGLSVNWSQIDGKEAILVGARGAWIINHGIAIGLGGYGFANDMSYNKTIDGIKNDYSLAGGYGGLIIEPIIGAKWPVHVSIPVLIGAGGVSLFNSNYYGDPYHNDYYYPESASAFFVVEPGIELELNMVKFMRIAFGGYYRITSGLDLADTKKNVLDGFSAGITLKFGKF